MITKIDVQKCVQKSLRMNVGNELLKWFWHIEKAVILSGLIFDVGSTKVYLKREEQKPIHCFGKRTVYNIDVFWKSRENSARRIHPKERHGQVQNVD